MKSIIRIIDANLNRGREGLRVVEDLVRFLIDDMDLSAQIKLARHEITLATKLLPLSEIDLIDARDSKNDVGAELNTQSEKTRTSLFQIAMANMRRAEESMRVLEEITKLYDSEIAMKYKRLRFRLYELEKQVLIDISKYEEQNLFQ